MNQLDLTDIYRKLHLPAAEYTFLSSTEGTFFRIDHVLCHKTSLDKVKNIEIIPSIFSNHNRMTIAKLGKFTNT